MMKGYKSCPCGQRIGVRWHKCPHCGHLFSSSQKSVSIPLPKSSIRNLLIPNGANPVKLQGADNISLIKWAVQVRKHWLDRGCFIMDEGLIYYLKWEEIFDDKEEELERASEVIRKVFRQT